MSAIDITKKLNALLKKHAPLTEECHAVYLMVELRKIMDHYDLNYPLLRFYADWMLHTDKRGNLDHIRPVSESIYTAIHAYLTAPKTETKGAIREVARFVCMQDLRDTMLEFLKTTGIEASLATDDENWARFVDLLTSVVADQPIIDPKGVMKEIRFRTDAVGCEFVFRNPIGDSMSYRYPEK